MDGFNNQLVTIEDDILYSRCYLYGLVATISIGSLQFGTFALRTNSSQAIHWVSRAIWTPRANTVITSA